MYSIDKWGLITHNYVRQHSKKPVQGRKYWYVKNLRNEAYVR